jgi:hypothetical protein
MTARSLIVGARRTAAIVATLGLFAVGAFCVHLVKTTEFFSSTEFRAASFQQAALERDNGEMQSQAQAAVDSGALIGLSAASLKRTLGLPSGTERRGSRYVWDLGATDGLIFDGWGASVLNVDFDAKTRRVEYAEIFQVDD